ncbi:MAG: BON domain-containing protein [Devosia sp.]
MINDSEQRQTVLDEVSRQTSIAAARVGVTAKEGVVTLARHVESSGESHEGEMAVGRVSVRAVVKNVEVRLLFHNKKGDDEIAAAVLGRIGRLSSIPMDAVKVEVEKGRVALSGQVEWHYQRDIVLREVRGLSGVIGIFNNISVKLRIDTTGIAEDITLALHRARSDPKTITVSANGGKVILGGTAKSWYDRGEAARVAWSAPGVTFVENNIAVN